MPQKLLISPLENFGFVVIPNTLLGIHVCTEHLACSGPYVEVLFFSQGDLFGATALRPIQLQVAHCKLDEALHLALCSSADFFGFHLL